MTSISDPGGYTPEVEAFMKAMASPEYKASQQPITVAEADALRENYKSLNKQFTNVLVKLAESVKIIETLSSKIAHLEQQEKQLRAHYKEYNEFRTEVLQRLKDSP